MQNYIKFSFHTNNPAISAKGITEGAAALAVVQRGMKVPHDVLCPTMAKVVAPTVLRPPRYDKSRRHHGDSL